mgnify:CR=1 FL=1|tara:strand:- start:1370 stop:2242 length:873 start_codon:yes stop_codon:yes gene_type:complete
MNKFIILIPVYNDWKSVFKLLEEIDIQTSSWKDDISVFLINDSSTEEKLVFKSDLKKLNSVNIINLKKNLGHARCYATGLKFISEKEKFDYAILMDADGEDRPEELNLFLEKLKNFENQVITADRIKRSEGLFFRLCYLIHKYLTFFFTGHLIKFGNFSCLAKNVVEEMGKNSSTWLSYSGSLTKIAKNRTFIPSIRGTRYFGPSKMSFFNLVIHSLSIISVFKKTVFLRSITFLIIYSLLIYKTLSFVTLIPFFIVLFVLVSTIMLSERENLDQLNSSLNNISNIEKLK